ncbi:nitrate reductase molybdenum cofactor assembly chaperone [Faucicola mancuniensis]|uniref:nitrate reductase molybdenum cofactor assembly chaperone n=1 Tax=Faucicola mancuniensis TaxID=1309795 RepID=UPI0028ECC473|nr:nitrate reductase molybdenum cofactor assembly chaperone [uncultured Moraxella sp.]
MTTQVSQANPTTPNLAMQNDMKLLKVLSLLMDYPSHELFIDGNLDECKQLVMTSRLISPQVRSEIASLIDEMLELGEMETQAKYDSLFERGRSLSLWLFEHVHGESRDRGQAMVDLMAQYEDAGFEINAKELPDYLPMYLEFLAYQAQMTGDESDNYRHIREEISNISHIVTVLSARLVDKNSQYVSLFKALLQIAGEPLSVIDDELAKLQKDNKPADDTAEAIDKEWEEEMVDFLGAEQENCPSSQTKQRIASLQGEQAQRQATVPVHWVDFNQGEQNQSLKNNAQLSNKQEEIL